MQPKNGYQTYRNVEISTADRGRLLLMMYEGAIKFLKAAQEGLQKNDLITFSKYLSKSQAIIAELMNTLDHEKGGIIARDLERLYDFMLFYLTEANLTRDVTRVKKVISLIETIYSGYKEIIESGAARDLDKSAGAKSSNLDQGYNSKEFGETIRRIQIGL
jgi:flagellar secretion chaperone FliS